MQLNIGSQFFFVYTSIRIADLHFFKTWKYWNFWRNKSKNNSYISKGYFASDQRSLNSSIEVFGVFYCNCKTDYRQVLPSAPPPLPSTLSTLNTSYDLSVECLPLGGWHETRRECLWAGNPAIHPSQLRAQPSAPSRECDPIGISSEYFVISCNYFEDCLLKLLLGRK